MFRFMPMRLAAALLVSLQLTTTAQAGGDAPKEFTAKGQIVLPSHKVKMEKDQIYVIGVKAKGFTPFVTIGGEFFLRPLPAIVVKPGAPRTDYTGTFTPRETKEYKIAAFPDQFSGPHPTGTLDYTLSVKPLVMAQKPLLKVTEMLIDKDETYPPRNNYYKPFLIKLKAGETYVIDHVRPGEDFKFDPYLYLEDANKKVVAQDDDSGGNLNARIIYTPEADGEFRIIATTLTPATGEFTLTVRVTLGAASTEKK
jgi:hypothetical protein